jgi:hypothetical protein
MTTTDEGVVLRCSSLPVIEQCGQAAHVGSDPEAINPRNAAATMGTAVHEYWARFVRAGEDQRPRMSDLVARHDIEDQAEFAKLCNFTLSQWASVGDPFDPVEIETRNTYDLGSGWGSGTGFILSGQCDARSIQPYNRIVYIFDLKTGWAWGNHRAQIMGYALLAFRAAQAKYGDGVIAEVRACTLHARHWAVQWHTFTAKDLEDFERSLIATVRDTTYQPGEQCEHCARRWHCTARQVMLQHAQATLLGADGTVNDIRQLPDFPTAYAQVKMIRDACSGWLSHVRDDVRERGPIEMGGDKVLRLVESQRTTLMPSRALPHITTLDAPKIDAVLSVSMRALRDAVADGLPKEEAKAEWDAFLERMHREGAISSTPSAALRVTNRPKSEGE